MNKLFNDKGFAIKDCRVTVYNYDRENNEYISSTQEHVVKGSGIPARSTFVKPLALKDGFTQIFDEEKQEWQYVKDHRYDEVYNIETKKKEDIRYLGALNPEHTLLAPPSFDHEFVGGEWIITEEKKAEIAEREKQAEVDAIQAERSKLMQEMQLKLLLGEQEEAKKIALKIKELDEAL